MKKVVIGLAILVAFGSWLISQYWYFLPGIMSDLLNPVADFREVTWQTGPRKANANERPPNVVLIVVDDLGFNDVTFYGGGIADGSVSTPRIDSIATHGIHFTK